MLNIFKKKQPIGYKLFTKYENITTVLGSVQDETKAKLLVGNYKLMGYIAWYEPMF